MVCSSKTNASDINKLYALYTAPLRAGSRPPQWVLQHHTLLQILVEAVFDHKVKITPQFQPKYNWLLAYATCNRHICVRIPLHICVCGHMYSSCICVRILLQQAMYVATGLRYLQQAYCYICVRILLHIVSLVLLYVRVHILLCMWLLAIFFFPTYSRRGSRAGEHGVGCVRGMCTHTTMYVSSSYYRCPHTPVYVLVY